MIEITDNAQNILQSYIDKYADYRQKGEYGTSAFWNWYYQVRHELLSLDKQNLHSMEDYNKIHAIGFIGDRVYSILPNGKINLLHMSKNDYLSIKHRYDESRKNKRLKTIINEAVFKALRRYIQ